MMIRDCMDVKKKRTIIIMRKEIAIVMRMMKLIYIRDKNHSICRELKKENKWMLLIKYFNKIYIIRLLKN